MKWEGVWVAVLSLALLAQTFKPLTAPGANDDIAEAEHAQDPREDKLTITPTASHRTALVCLCKLLTTFLL